MAFSAAIKAAARACSARAASSAAAASCRSSLTRVCNKRDWMAFSAAPMAAARPRSASVAPANAVVTSCTACTVVGALTFRSLNWRCRSAISPRARPAPEPLRLTCLSLPNSSCTFCRELTRSPRSACAAPLAPCRMLSCSLRAVSDDSLTSPLSEARMGLKSTRESFDRRAVTGSMRATKSRIFCSVARASSAPPVTPPASSSMLISTAPLFFSFYGRDPAGSLLFMLGHCAPCGKPDISPLARPAAASAACAPRLQQPGGRSCSSERSHPS